MSTKQQRQAPKVVEPVVVNEAPPAISEPVPLPAGVRDSAQASKDNKLLVVYNCCGILGKERHDIYIQHLTHLLEQDFQGFRVCISGCEVSKYTEGLLKDRFGDRLSYHWIDTRGTVNVGFNHTVSKCVKHFGRFDGYVYMASDVDVGPRFAQPDTKGHDGYKGWNNGNLLRWMHDRLTGSWGQCESKEGGVDCEQEAKWFVEGWPLAPHKCCERHKDLMVQKHGAKPSPLSSNVAMVAARVDNDNGYEWTGIKMQEDRDVEVTLGKSCNLHMQAFGHSLLEAYGRLVPDIFTGDTTESVFTFLCAAIKKKFIILHKPTVHHKGNMDGGSSGLGRGATPFRPRYTDLKAICEEGHQYGFGYEECSAYCIHDPFKYDAEGHPKDARLLPFMKQHLFLPPDALNYDGICSEFIP